MAKHIINKAIYSKYTINKSDDIWIFGGSATISSLDTGIYESSVYHDNTIVLKGKINASATGIDSSGVNTSLTIEKSATIAASQCIILQGAGASAVNHGDLLAGSYGIYAVAADIEVTNDGYINAVSGVYIFGNHARFVNQAGGMVVSAAEAAKLSAAAGERTVTINHGALLGGVYGFEGGLSNEKVINDGRIMGLILMDDGNDRFDNRGGKIDDGVYGGLGNDTLIVDRSGTKLFESPAEGNDTVKSTVSYELSDNVENLTLLGSANINGEGNAGKNRLDGNSGDNQLIGRGGADRLNGHGGDDRMSGNAGSDIFVFATKGGHDVVTDFQNTIDLINLKDWSEIKGYTDLVKHHVTFDGKDMVITAGADMLTVKNFSEGSLDITDFIL